MFTRWGDLVYRFRFLVLAAVVAALLALGGFGFGIEKHLSASGWDDPTSQSTQAAQLKDEAYGRDHTGDVILLYTAPDGKTVDDPEFSQKITDSLINLPKQYPDQIDKVNVAYWRATGGAQWTTTGVASPDKKSTFATLAVKGSNDTEMVNNFREIKDVFDIPGVEVQVAGMQAVSGTLNDTMAQDQKRMEVIAIPVVAVLLFFIFGGVVAAALPLIVGGLTVLGANGIVMAITKFTEVNSFVSPVVSMIGLGLAIDYGLFMVSRFREEMAEGYTTASAVRRSVMTAGRTVAMSATMIIAASAGMLLFPQGFLKSVAYGTIATVLLAALTALTVLPALLGILGRRVDMLGLKWFRKTKTAEEIENGFWGKSTQWVMKHPLKVAIPLCILLLLLIIPVKDLKFGGISETYLPPDNPTRVAQEQFDQLFPQYRSNPLQLVMVTDNPSGIYNILKEANEAPGLATKFKTPDSPPGDSNVWATQATLVDADTTTADEAIDYLRTNISVPDDMQFLVTGQPAIQKDSIDALLSRMPLMIALVVLVTTLLMFLTFGSLVLPIKAALMSALGLGSTLGILTWIFVDGHAAGLLNFTPQPIMSPVLVLIIAIIYGLSTDYEVFLLSRMVEARTMGASTTEAVRIGTAQTGRIITAAALILLVVTGAFAFSDLVMMQYIAYGMIAALFIDATVLRMLLVPATMKLLGDDCWWAPKWMKKIQQKIGLGEPILDDERPGTDELVDLVKTTPVTDPVTLQIPVLADGTPAKPARKKKPKRARFIGGVDGEAPTQRLGEIRTEPGRPGDTGNLSGSDAGQEDSGSGSAGATALPSDSTPQSSGARSLLNLGTEQDDSAGDAPDERSASPDSGTTQQNPTTPRQESRGPQPGPFAPQTTPQTNLKLPRAIEPQSGVIGVTPRSEGMPTTPVRTQPSAPTPPDSPRSSTETTPSRPAAPTPIRPPLSGPIPEPPSASVPSVSTPSVSTPSISTPQTARPPLPPRTIRSQDQTRPTEPAKPAAPGEPTQPTAPVGTTPRVLPPQPNVAPHPASRAQLFQSSPGHETASPTKDSAPAQEQAYLGTEQSFPSSERKFTEPEQSSATPELPYRTSEKPYAAREQSRAFERNFTAPEQASPMSEQSYGESEAAEDAYGSPGNAYTASEDTYDSLGNASAQEQPYRPAGDPYGSPESSHTTPGKLYPAPERTYSPTDGAYEASEQSYETTEKPYAAPQQPYSPPGTSFADSHQAYSATSEPYPAPSQDYNAADEPYSRQQNQGTSEPYPAPEQGYGSAAEPDTATEQRYGAAEPSNATEQRYGAAGEPNTAAEQHYGPSGEPNIASEQSSGAFGESRTAFQQDHGSSRETYSAPAQDYGASDESDTTTERGYRSADESSTSPGYGASSEAYSASQQGYSAPGAYTAPEQSYAAPEHQDYGVADQSPSAPEQSANPSEAPDAPADNPPDDSERNTIERWMADLRSSRRRPEHPDPDEGKHSGGAGRTVSVNELLRRQNRD
ncbi:MMPL family transporter [Nocardia wallacei]|uniref:MMPL family transporter n=1 Tax=Nocardia wallacei TaxID=480035 RepID=UPI0024586FFE|nr:MMPL family transporter [Nocardia wallacei]